MNTYEIRSAAGRPVYAFDDLARACEAKAIAEKRTRTTMRLFEIVRTEREIEGKAA